MENGDGDFIERELGMELGRLSPKLAGDGHGLVQRSR